MMLRYLTSLCLILFLIPVVVWGEEKGQRSRINLTDLDEVCARRPLIIAHRGGVITEAAPECSRAAIRLAASAGYDMVELDIRESSDHVPVVFHDRSLLADCGIDKRPSELTAAELIQINYQNTDQKILTLEQALEVSAELSLGVMYDIKQFSEESLKRVVQLTRQFNYEQSLVTINGDPTIQRFLKPVSRIRLLSLEQAQELQLQSNSRQPLLGYFWFGQSKHVPLEKISYLRSLGALVIPGVNRFRYPDENHEELVEKDIQKMLSAGVDGFQVDSMYDHLFEKIKQEPSR